MNNSERHEHVRRQLEQRREVLAQWAETGISSLPQGTSVPVSLNQVRLWESPQLGISAIGSPSSVTTTHRMHGPVVREIDRLLADLARQRAAQDKSKQRRAAKRKRRLAVLESTLASAANRYAVLSVELQDTQLRLRVAEQSVAAFKTENGELRTEIRNLKLELARRSSLGTVTHLGLPRPAPA